QLSVERIVKRRPCAGIETLAALDPGPARCTPTSPDLAPRIAHRLRNFEGRMWPIQGFARRRDFIGSQRSAMHLLGALPVRRAVADDRAAGDQRRLVGSSFAL